MRAEKFDVTCAGAIARREVDGQARSDKGVTPVFHPEVFKGSSAAGRSPKVKVKL
jgi:hypothetical protein